MRIVRALGRGVGGALLLSVLILIGLAVRIDHESHTATLQHADAIVVLGAAQYNGTPSPVLAARLNLAADLFADGLAPRVITTGGNRAGDRSTEAEAGAAYLVDAGIDATAVFPVSRGSDTLVSLRAAAQMLRAHGWYDVILVTDRWHMARSRMIARDLGLAVQTAPVQTGPAAEPAVRNRYIARELAAMVFYRLVGGSSGIASTVL